MTPTQGSRLIAAGFAVTLLAVSAGVGSGEYSLLLGLVGALVGTNLVVLGVRTTAVRALAASRRRNLAAAGLTLASSAVTVVSGDASPELCCAMFALLLLGISLITVGIIFMENDRGKS